MASDDSIMRSLSPWLLRADEVAASEPRVAYYLREHAMQEALRLGNASSTSLPRTKKALQALMTLLETDRPKAGLQGKAADGAHVRAFASSVFDRADARDRSGAQTEDTAHAFAAAALFFELARDFEALDEGCSAKQQFATWRAADLSNRLGGGPGLQSTAAPPAPAATAQDSVQADAPGPPPPVGGDAPETPEERAEAESLPAPPHVTPPRPEAGASPHSGGGGDGLWAPGWGDIASVAPGDMVLYREPGSEATVAAHLVCADVEASARACASPVSMVFRIKLTSSGEELSAPAERLAPTPKPAQRRVAEEDSGLTPPPPERESTEGAPGSLNLSREDSAEAKLFHLPFLGDSPAPPSVDAHAPSAPMAPPHLYSPPSAPPPPPSPPVQPPPPSTPPSSPPPAQAAAPWSPPPAAPVTMPPSGRAAGGSSFSSADRTAAVAAIVAAQASATSAYQHLRWDDIPEAVRELSSALDLLTRTFPDLVAQAR